MRPAHVMPIKTKEEATAKLAHGMSRIARFALEMPSGFHWQASVTRFARVAGLLVLIAGVPASAQTTQTMETMVPAQSTCPGPAPTFPQMTYDEDDGYFSSSGLPNQITGPVEIYPAARRQRELLPFLRRIHSGSRRIL